MNITLRMETPTIYTIHSHDMLNYNPFLHIQWYSGYYTCSMLEIVRMLSAELNHVYKIAVGLSMRTWEWLLWRLLYMPRRFMLSPITGLHIQLYQKKLNYNRFFKKQLILIKNIYNYNFNNLASWQLIFFLEVSSCILEYEILAQTTFYSWDNR